MNNVELQKKPPLKVDNATVAKNSNKDLWADFFNDNTPLSKNDLTYMNKRPMNRIPKHKEIF